MTVKEQIREYRNTHPETRIVLGVLLSEIDRGFNPSQVTDEDCYKAIRFMMKANIETGNLEENKLLEIFLPASLSESEIKQIIQDQSFGSIGECMKFFKENYPQRYDGGQVSKIFNTK